MNTLVKCAVCGIDSYHKFNGSTNAFGAVDLDTRPLEMDQTTIQRCPNCGYCNSILSELMKGANEYLDSDEYRVQLTNKKFPELVNSFLCAGLLHEYAEEYNKAGWDCLNAAKVCDDKKKNKAAVYCRRRALAMFEEATESGQRFEDNASKERQLLADITRRVGLVETAEEK